MFYSSDIEELLENYQEIKINVEIADQSSLKELSKLRELYEMLNIEKDSKKMEIRSSSKYKDFKKNKVWFFSIDVNGKELNYVLNNSFPIFINEKSIKKIADKCGIAEDVCRLTEHDMNVYKRQINQYEYNDWDNRYKGTRARDEGGLSDECIDEALDGDPSNYINLE